MPQRNTYFTPTAVIRTDTDTGERTLEIDWGSSMIKDNDAYSIDAAGSDLDGQWLDEIVTDKALWEPTREEGVVRIISLDPLSNAPLFEKKAP